MDYTISDWSRILLLSSVLRSGKKKRGPSIKDVHTEGDIFHEWYREGMGLGPKEDVVRDKVLVMDA